MKIFSKRLEVQYYLCTNNNVPRGTFEPREVRSAEIRTLRLISNHITILFIMII
jgi:hypothetical protein